MPKNFVGEPFSVSLISGIEKLHASEGYVTIIDFPSKFFCPTVPKIFAGEPFCAVFRKISGIEKKLDKRGGASRLSVEIFVVSHCQKFL